MSSAVKRLVDRDSQLLKVSGVLARSREEGQVLVVTGEAGHGKTTLIENLLARLDHRHTLLAGACDPVSVPTPFAPLFEILEALPTDLGGSIREGKRRHDIYAGMLAMLEAGPTVLVLEDLQWADEATLGLVRYLGRRLARTRSLLVLSYRPEEVDTAHPLLVVLADLIPVATTLITPPLTIAGVSELASDSELDPVLLHATTGGNPFFVEEILANPGDELPVTIGAAILAGVASLPTGSLDLLEMVTLSPEGLDLVIAEQHSSEAGRNIDAAYQRRLLVEDRGRLKCRHDLIRITVDQSIPPARRRRIHLRLLESLEPIASSPRDMARLAHHAVQAGVAGKAVKYSLAAAAFAAAEGANRQARLHYGAALAFRSQMDPVSLDDALLGSAEVSCATNHLAEASAAAQERLDLASDDHDLGDRLAWSAFIASRWGNVPLARADAIRALRLHDGFDDCPEQARARSVLATIAVWEADWPTASRLAAETVEQARELGSPGLLAAGLLILGKADALLGRPGWERHLEEAQRLGIDSGELETACAALNSLAFLSYWQLDLSAARERFARGIEFAATNEMDAWYVAMAASKAACDLAAGDWEEAEEVLQRAIAWPTCASTDCEAKLLLAMLRCRQGHPDAPQLVESALAETDVSGTHSELVLAAALGMEAAWLGFLDLESATERYMHTMARASGIPDPKAAERLSVWAPISGWIPSEAGEADAGTDFGMWVDRGYVYEAHLLEATHERARLPEVFDWLERRGADGVLRALRRDLRARGVRGIPRPPREPTSSNVLGLTRRQMEVLEHIASGETNAAIASALYISEKTVDHHVSAILSKLGVQNRLQAVAKASEHGFV